VADAPELDADDLSWFTFPHRLQDQADTLSSSSSFLVPASQPHSATRAELAELASWRDPNMQSTGLGIRLNTGEREKAHCHVALL